jgi:hypothetical protein
MFGHNSFVWTPVKVFNAGTEATSDYTGPFVIIRAKASGMGLYNEDGTDYANQFGIQQLFGGANIQTSEGNWEYAHTREEAIALAVASLPNGMYYKVEDGGYGRLKTDIPPPDYTVLCPSLNREIKEVSGGKREGADADAPIVSWTKQGCGKCLSGFKEPGDRGEDYSCSPSLFTSCDEACIPEVNADVDGEEETDTNWLMIGGGIAGVIALAFFGMG